MPVSPITTIRAGINLTGFSHIISHRRQIYVKPDDLDKISQRLEINFDDTKYWIYFSSDKLTCFQCKQEGHLAKFCKEAETSTLNETTGNEPNNILQEKIVINTNKEESTKPTEILNENFPAITTATFKRPISTTNSSISNIELSNPNKAQENQKTRQAEKRLKADQETITKKEMDQKLEPAKEFITVSENRHKITYDSLDNFLVASHGQSNITEIALLYTNNLTSLDELLAESYQFIIDRNLKSKITRIRKRIKSDKNADKNATSESYSSDSSSAI